MECILVLCCLAFTFYYFFSLFLSLSSLLACFTYSVLLDILYSFFGATIVSFRFFAFATCTTHKTLVRSVYLCICVSTTSTVILYLAAFWKIGFFFTSRRRKKNNKFDSTVGFFYLSYSLFLCQFSFVFSAFCVRWCLVSHYKNSVIDYFFILTSVGFFLFSY